MATGIVYYKYLKYVQQNMNFIGSFSLYLYSHDAAVAAGVRAADQNPAALVRIADDLSSAEGPVVLSDPVGVLTGSGLHLARSDGM